MAELTARERFSCPACGGEARWDAARQALACPYCGTAAPGELATDRSKIEERDLVAALRGLHEDQRGWKADRVSVKCRSCQAISVLDPSKAGQRCEFCGASQLVPYDQIKAPIRPESVLPCKISESQARDSVRRWYGTHLFAPDRLKTAALTDTVHGLYIPYWTFDAQVHADWTAEAGYHYYVTETVRDSNGRSSEVQVRKTRWEPAAGSLDQFFDDELVPATVGVPAQLLRRIEPFPTAELVPYDPGYLSGWVVEQYQIDLVAAAEHSRSIMQDKIERLCAREVPGDTSRSLAVRADFSAQTFKHILVPVWLLSYTYGPRKFHIVLNGHTGAIAGNYPLSWIKVTVAVFIGLLLLVLTLYLSGRFE